MTAVCAVVNGGKLLLPYIVQRIIEPDGTVSHEQGPVVKRQVISEGSSAVMRDMMETTVTEGNGKNVSVAGYRIGGKSGTSQKLDSENEKARIASFVGVAPIEDPELAVLVCLDEPHSWTTAGGSLSAPVVAQVLEASLAYYGVEKVYTPEQQKRQLLVMPDLRGTNTAYAVQTIENAGCTVSLKGEGKVKTQFPCAGELVSKGSTVFLYTDEEEPLLAQVPAISGLTADEAQRQLEAAGFNLKARGVPESSGAIAFENYAGEWLPMGSVLDIGFYEIVPEDD